MEIKSYSNKKAYFFAITIVALIVASPYIGAIANYAALVLFVVSACSLQKIDLYIILFAIFPFANIFKASAESMSFLTICEIIMFILVFADFLSKKITVKASFMGAVFLFFAYLLIMGLDDFSFSIFSKMIVRPFILYSLFNSKADYEKKKAVTIGLTYMLALSMILMLFLTLNSSFMERIVDYLRVVQMQNGLRQLTRNGGLFDDPNYCSLAIMMTLSLLAVLYYSKQIGTVHWLLAIPLIVMGFTTYSKSYFLCIIAYAILMVLLVLIPKHRGWDIVAIIALFYIGYAVMSGSVEVVNLILRRFENGDITTGRNDIAEAYLEYLNENPMKLFFGNGIAIHQITGMNNVHNLFIECLYKIGIVGSILYCFIIRCSMYTGGTSKKLVAYLPTIFMLVMYMALAGLVTFELLYYLIICGVAVKYTGSEKKKKGEIKYETV